MEIGKSLPLTRSVCKYRPKKKNKNMEYDYKERYAVMQHFDDFGMASTLDPFYAKLVPAARGRQRRKIYQWIGNLDYITPMTSSPTTAKYKCWRKRRTGTLMSAECEDQLVPVRSVYRMRCNIVPITQNMLRIIAFEAAIDEGYNDDEYRASCSWLDAFKRRHRLSLRSRTRVGQVSNDGEQTL
ncbi:unnamed protein product [Aphanomyces euteiches]